MTYQKQLSIGDQSVGVDWLMRVLQFWSVLSAGLMIAVTYRLWLPPQWSSFPQIPASSLLVNAPAWCDYFTLAGLVSSMLIVLWKLWGHSSQASRIQSSLLHRGAFICILIFGIASVLLNQHRLQAWFFQLLIFCVIFLLKDDRRQLRWLRRIVLSIYVYSALGKLDHEFAHTTGQELLGATLNALGSQLEEWSLVDRTMLALCLPLAELVLAIILGWCMWKSSREDVSPSIVGRFAYAVPGMLTCSFHVLLAALLLWQLQHSWGVVLWNLQFAFQAVLLFVQPLFAHKQADNVEKSVTKKVLSREWLSPINILLIATMALPATERMGYWDHWPSWALYAPHSSRVSVSVAPFAMKQLPDQLQSLLPEPLNVGSAVPIPLSQWSLNSLHAPVYPQARFQLGVARYLAARLDSNYAMNCEVLSVADRFTGKRQSQIFTSTEQLEKASHQFWLNSQPRWSPAIDLPSTDQR